MKLHHTQTELEGDLFSGLEDQENVQPEVSPYDKIIESRKNATFAAEQIESQDEVQVVEKAEVPAAEPVVEEPVVEKPVRKSEIKTDTTSLKLEEELKMLSEKDYSKKDSEPVKENAPQPRIKTSDEEDIEARQSERLSEIDKLLQELDSKSE